MTLAGYIKKGGNNANGLKTQMQCMKTPTHTDKHSHTHEHEKMWIHMHSQLV